jgi:nitrate reductase gamma subunit
LFSIEKVLGEVNGVEAWIEFGRGPLFRLAFSLMVLGLARVLVLTVAGIVESYRRSRDRIVPWKDVARQTLGWLFPAGRLWRKRPAYSATSFLFHVGLLTVPLFLAAHVLSWKRATGFAWPAMPQAAANWLTLLAIAGALGLLFGRLFHRSARTLSRRQDYMWPALLAVPFATGYFCANAAIGPKTYQWLMLTHVYSANLIMLMIPFTKIAHCVLAPLSQVVTAVAWKFPAGAGDLVAATLGHADRPTWANNARIEIDREIYR